MGNGNEKSPAATMGSNSPTNVHSTIIAKNPRGFAATIAISAYLILATLSYRVVEDDKSIVLLFWFFMIPVRKLPFPAQ
jgi:hypothetical protein